MKWNTGKPIPDDAKMVGAVPVRPSQTMFGAIPVQPGNTAIFGAVQKPGYPNGSFVGSHWVQAGA